MNEDILKEIEFSELGKTITGKTPKTKIDEYWNGIIPFITPKDIQVNKYINFTERYISDAGLHTVSGQYLPKNSICVSCIGNIGYVGLTTKESISNQQINTIIPNNNFDNDYVFYLMRNYWPIFKSLENQSTTVSILNKSHFSSLKVKVINDKIKQKAIANILSSLDDKIDLNNKLNQNLEKLAQTLYKHWFVDFEFPNENGEPYKSSGGEMVDSELGLIPKGWSIQTLKDLIVKQKNKILPNEKYKLIDMASMPSYSISLSQYEPGNKLNTNTFSMEKYSFLYGSIRPYLGKYGIAPFNGITTGTIHNFKSKIMNNYSFVASLVFSNKFNDYCIQLSHGTKMPIVKWNDFIDYKFAFNDRLASLYDETIKSNYLKIVENVLVSQKLAEIRDTLLPKLMNGEIEVPV